MRSLGKIFCLLALLSCCNSPQAAAIDLHHTSWTGRDGAPAMVLSMTQTKDGWLWLGGPMGLYRFDGMQFEQFAPANEPLLTRNVSVVSALDDGSLWIGYRTGGAARLQQGRIHNYSERDGLPSRAVWGVERDAEGRIWAATAQGMYYLENDRWQVPASAWQLPDGWYKTLMRDRQGTLWVQGDPGIFFLRPGAKQFARAPVSSGTGVLFNLPDGSVLSWDAARARFNRLAGTAQGRSAQQWQRLGDPTSLLFDRHGNLWVGLKSGLEYRTGNAVFGNSPSQGLSGPSVGALFEDREGNIWAATSTGIDRFRGRRLEKVEVPESAIGAAIMADDSGGAWIGGFHVAAGDGGAARVTPLWPAERGGWANWVTGYTRSSDGILWGTSFGALRRIDGRDHRKIAAPGALGNRLLTNIQADDNGDLLAAVQQLGLYRRKADGEWQQDGGEGEVNVMARSDTLGLWLGYFPGLLVQQQGAKRRSYGSADGLALGLVMALQPHGSHLWAGGDKGLALFEGGRFKQVNGIDDETFDGISGIVELDNGDLWLNAATGLFHIPDAEIARFKRDPAYRVHYGRIDQLDGLEGSAPRVTPSPSLVQASDKRLWIVRSTGVFRLDPGAQLPHAPAQPAVIKTIGPLGEGKALHERVQLAPGVSALQIDYTIPSLAMPERVRFRYRLDGVEDGWQEAGARRSAYYSDLAPGDYRFRLAASDYNGQWNDQQTVLAFTIVPAITQTWWFRTLCGGLLLSAAYLVHRWRISRMARHMAHRLQERVRERERIARELHDTLLQSVQSLILHVHAAVIKLPQKDALRLQLENALRQADNVVDEGRGRIRELRGEDEDKLNLADAILATAERLRLGGGNAVQLTMRGKPRQLDGAIYQETLAIVNEAIANACSHARAKRIEVELHYGTREFCCHVRDDGEGIPADIVNVGGRQNHWGMRGMAERAARIDAKLVLRSSAATGTEWQLVLPAALAYTR